MNAHLALVLFVLLGLRAGGAPALSSDSNSDGRPDQWFEASGGKIVKTSLDRNFDGRIDFIVDYDAKEQKLHEELDYNYDGAMDDFYFYEQGRLVRQEIDANFDGKVDIWVYLCEGLYIERYERDVDYDGKVDLVKKFGWQ